MKSDTIQELKAIKRLMIGVKDLCPHLVNERLLNGVDQWIKLHESKLINAMPIYRWLLSDTSLIDLSEDCIEVAVEWGIKKADQKVFEGKILPIFKSPVHSTEEMMFYSELAAAELIDMGNNDIDPYSIEEYSANGPLIE